MRAEFAKLCLETLKEDSKSVVMVGDISHFLLRESEGVASDRFYNIGICEQSMVGIASGMALDGMRPIIHTISPFLVERAFEQIKNDIGYQNTEVTIVTVGGTYDYADLGCTHHCYGDIAMMRLVPNMQVFEPSSPTEFRKLFKDTWKNGHPKYFRLTKEQHSQQIDVTPGDLEIVRESKDGRYVFVTGHILDDVLESPNIGVIYVHTLSHINSESKKHVGKLLRESKKVYSVENHFTIGGLGDLISDTYKISVDRIGLDRKFLTNYGSYNQLRRDAGMDRDSILRRLSWI
jgi:transketolase